MKLESAAHSADGGYRIFAAESRSICEVLMGMLGAWWFSFR
jgi:hypothetical protein